MLNIIFGETATAIYNTSVYFDNTYYDGWLDDEFARKMIKDIDKATVLSNHAIESKALGVIPVTKMSGGLKTLLLIYNNPEKIFNASTCGDNCSKWILKIAQRSDKDIIVNLRHVMDFGDKAFDIKILNNGVVVHSMSEYVQYAGLFIGGRYEGQS
ncbi:DUF4869 domain-containing protein [Butyrivibrio sp. AE2032]|uniref:DUF4869 domain-containing protein n=1 Tax=Butyrivibrio sp. AE2032 TaxID=1458463 RepID=UPI00054FE9CB|nr:DUF4869 domain-containing protein [Butyrivibrio sp. AE2032]